MIIITGFVLPAVLYLITLPIKALIKKYQSGLADDSAKPSLYNRLGTRVKDKLSTNPNKVVKTLGKTAIKAIKVAILGLKMLVNVIRCIIWVIQVIVSLSAIAMVLVIVLLVSALVCIILLLNSVKVGSTDGVDADKVDNAVSMVADK